MGFIIYFYYNIMIQNIYNNSSFYTKIKLPSLFSKRYLIRWQPNHRTKLHNHNNMKCEFYLLKGQIKEIQFNQNNIISNKLLSKFLDKAFITDKIGNHIVENTSKNISYTYHIYKY